MAVPKEVRFEASARLQRLIGRGLIPNDEMAVVELVKNAYDSGAQLVRVVIQADQPKEPGYIRIIDDGAGMSVTDIVQLFMFAGYSERPDEAATAKRTPTGEKGIGRFAADKLGSTLDVFTKKSSGSGLHLSIDWRKFDVKGRKKFSDIIATYTSEDVSSRVRSRSGTTLEIRHLRKKWDRMEVEKLVEWLSDLINPFSKPSTFAIEVEMLGGRRGAIRIDPQPPVGDVSMDVRVTKNSVHRTIREKGEKDPTVSESKESAADLSPLGALRARFVHFDRKPTKDATHGLRPGVRVYRDGFRIEPFGSRSADWLGISEERAKRAGHAHIVPNRLFGFVEISRRSNPGLGDTTSRQALMDTPAASSLVTVLRENLGSLAEVLRQRKEPRWKESRLRRQAELEQARLFTLGEMASGLAHELRQPMQSIRSEAQNIATRLAQIGIEDKDINESQQSIDRGIDRIDRNIRLVSDLSLGNLTDLKETDLVTVVRSTADHFYPTCTSQSINLALKLPDHQIAKASEIAISIIIWNLIRNAIQALEAKAADNKTISVTLSKIDSDHRIEVSDNGDGVPDDLVPKLFSRFATQKTGGMGVGLYYSKMLVEAHKGKIGYTSTRRGPLFWVEFPQG